MAGMESGQLSGRKLEKMVLRRLGKCVADFDLVREGDRVAVALSGGKDSFSLLLLMEALRRRSPVNFELIALTIHNGSELFQSDLLEAFLKERGIPFHLERTDLVRIVEEKLRPGTPYCSLCARLRRGALYGAAERLGCNKLALGHHLDDAIETLLMNLFFEGALKAMPPKLLAESGRTTVIRPLLYIPEEMLVDFARDQALPILDCGCWLCGEREGERARMKTLVAGVSERYPKARRAALKALTHLQPRFLLDPTHHDFSQEETAFPPTSPTGSPAPREVRGESLRERSSE